MDLSLLPFYAVSEVSCISGNVAPSLFTRAAPLLEFPLPTGTGNAAEATATLDDYDSTGGTISALGLTTGGKFYTSVPTVTISHPGTSFASATIGIAGSSVNPGSIAFSTTGRAYTTAPTVAISTSSGQDAPTQVAVGIATIHPITGIVTAVSFSISDAWATGTGATVGAGYTVAPVLSFSGSPSPVQATATVTVSVAGTVSSISIGNSGFGYNSVPTVTIGAPEGANEAFRALGIATIRFNSVQTQGTVGIGSTTITGITTTNILVGDRVRLGVGYSDLYNFIPTDTFVTSIGSSTITMNQSPTNVGIATSVFEFGIDQCGIVTGIIVTYGGGGLIIGVDNIDPKTPPFDIENVPPVNSSIESLPSLAFFPKSEICFSIFAKLKESTFLKTGTTNPRGEPTAIPMS